MFPLFSDRGFAKIYICKYAHAQAPARYAVGLVYIPESGFDAEKELEKLKEAMMLRYKTV